MEIDRLGKYQLLAQIPYGSLGRVYRAEDPLLKRIVAVKVLVERRVTAAVRARFLAEARASAKLTHRNIVAVYDAGEDQGRLYVVMEYVDGEGIEAVIRRRSEVPLPSKLEIMRQICRGLRYAHETGVVHAGVQADNVLVLPDGTVKLLDCGLARIALTAPAAPPERGRTGGDRRADIFAAAALFYELTASGTPAAPGSARASAQAPDASAPASLFAPDPAIPAELGAVLERALMRDPAARFQDMAELEAALEKLGGGHPRPEGAARWPAPKGAVAQPAATGTVTFPILPTAGAAPPVGPSAGARIAPARPGVLRRIAAMVAARPVTAMVGTAAVALIGAGGVYWYVAIRVAPHDVVELDAALEQLAAARVTATEANAELLSTERFAEAVRLDRAQRDLVEMQHPREAAASARAAAQAYIGAAREAADAARAAADSARAGVRADNEPGQTGTPPPPAPPAINADAQIREVLGAYARAFETKDIELLRQIRPGMTPAEVARHHDVFAQTHSYRVGLRIDRIVVRGNEAEARGEREDTIVTSGGDTIRHPPEDFRFALRRVGEQWRIDRIR